MDALVAERVWQELSRGLMEAKPSRMFEVLRECGALARLLPEVDRLWGVPQRADYHPEVDTGVHLMMVLDMSARLSCAAAGALRLPHARPGQGHDARGVLPRHIGHEQRSAGLLRTSASACACRPNAASWRRWWRGSTATSTAASSSALRLWCGCSSAAMPFASPSVSTRHCWPANATRAAGWAWRKNHIPSGTRLLAALAAAQAVATHEIAAEAQQAQIEGPKIGEMIHKARVQAVDQLPAAGRTYPR